VITPVAELEPVVLAGTTVSRATLHNWEEMERKDIRVGDVVVVAKGGDIIPKVLRVVPERRSNKAARIPRPTLCPVCDHAVVQRPGEVAIRCDNRFCPAVTAGQIRHFVGRQGCDIEGLGGRWIDLFLELGLIQDAGDLFGLKRSVLVQLPGWGEKSADNLLAALGKAKDRPWANKVFALGIPNVGITTATTLASRFINLEKLAAATETEIADLPDIGPVVAQAIVEFFRRAETNSFLKGLREAGFFKASEELPPTRADQMNSYFAGKSFVLTGTLENQTRAEAKQFIVARGGKVTSSLSKKTAALIVGKNPGSKLAKAEKLGVATLSEARFLELLQDKESDNAS
jgi:DNA ligase (NAD+)